MDAQTSASETSALASLVQAVAPLEFSRRATAPTAEARPEVLAENRFLAARDGMGARLIDAVAEERVRARAARQAARRARPHAVDLGCESSLDALATLADQRAPVALRVAREAGRLPGMVELLSDAFVC